MAKALLLHIIEGLEKDIQKGRRVFFRHLLTVLLLLIEKLGRGLFKSCFYDLENVYFLKWRCYKSNQK